MWIFVVVAVIALIAGFGRDAFKRLYYKRNLYDMDKFMEDAKRPYTSSMELNANMRSGKYRKPKKNKNTQTAKATTASQGAATSAAKNTGVRSEEQNKAAVSGKAQASQGVKARQDTATKKSSYSKIEQDAIDVLEHASTDMPVELETLTQEEKAETSYISDSQRKLNAGAVANAKSDFAEIENRFKEGQNVFPRAIGDYVFFSFDYESYAISKCFSAISNNDYSRTTNKYGASLFLKNREENVLYLETIQALGQNAGISIVPMARDMDNKIEIMEIPSSVSSLQLPCQIVFRLRCTTAHPNI